MSHLISKHPRALWILSLTEMCERFAFWGVGNLLVLYLIQEYQFAGDKATQIYGIFTGFAAFLPLVGGWLADRWNHKSPMVLGAIFNAIGCFCLASGIIPLFYPALFLIALGYGIFTPSIITMLSFAYRHHAPLREAGFSIYYASINVGVFLALASLGTIANLVSWNLAFIVAGSVQVIGLIPLIVYLVRYKEDHTTLKALHKKTHTTQHTLSLGDKKRLFVIFISFLASFFFWTAYNQGFSSIEIFSYKFMNRIIGGVDIPEGIFLSSESFFLILLAPFLSFLYVHLQKKDLDPSPLKKTALGLFFISACFALMMVGSLQIPAGAATASVSWGFLVGSFFLMAVGEMLLAPIGLSLVSRLAPPKYASMLIGSWYVSTGLAFSMGGYLAGFMERFGRLTEFFLLFVLITIIPGAILLFLSSKLTKMSHTEETHVLPHVER